MTAAISASSALTTGTAKGSTAAPTIGGDFNTFLRMLTTQLQNQDPTNAMDPTQMTNQLVAFAQVEQQISMNSNLNALISLQQAQALTTGASLVGHQVELSGDTLPLQDGRATLKLPAAGAANMAQIQVLDGSGAVLRSATVTLGASSKNWVWDGRTDVGQLLPDGTYTYKVAGLGASGASSALTATAVGTATGIQRQNNSLNLMFGTAAASMDRVVSVD